MTQAADAFSAYFADANVMDVALNAGLSVLLLAGAALIGSVLTFTLRSVFKRIATRFEAMQVRRPPQALALAAFIVRSVVWLSAFAVLLSLWGVDALAWAAGPGAPYIYGALRIVVVLVIAIVAWEAAALSIGGLFEKAAVRAATARRASQLRSLAPMLRGAARAAIVTFAGMVVISQLGVEIAPLLAGAGVVGIAVGFGAQTLVKDYLTGFSLILEDIVSVGDIVRIGDSGGLVETMALRTIRLRDFDGTLHVIPYSEAQTVHNLTKTFSYYVFDLPISYDSDIDRALELMRDVGAQLQKDAAFANDILEPIEVVGVDSLADSAVLLKARIKTAPIKQWSVGREYNRRIKLAFDEAGIEIPVPHLKLLLSDRALAAVQGGH
ncbi:MAG TPA: mechanosensitive ion channel family protein [Caulobacterales bacterium]|nr:mechanosensitive ion channel family protein [Caulobacterales bacterium]